MVKNCRLKKVILGRGDQFKSRTPFEDHAIGVNSMVGSDEFDSSGHLETLGVAHSDTGTVVKFGWSKTGVNSMVGLELSSEFSRAGLEKKGILD